jgi:Flp pilus assembly protein TadD
LSTLSIRKGIARHHSLEYRLFECDGMSESKPNRSSQLRVSPPRTASGEQRILRPPPPPKRAAHAEPSQAARAENAFGEDESPTLALSKPILNLLATETAPISATPVTLPSQPDAETPSVIVLADEPELSAAGAEQTQPAVRVQLHTQASLVRASSSRKRTRLLVSAFVLCGLVLGGVGWMSVHHAGAHAETPPRPLAQAVTLAEPVPEVAAPPATPIEPAIARAAPDSALSEPENPASITTLLATDGSETKAPSCDDLLAPDSVGQNEAWADSIGVARRALVRGDMDGSQRAFCKALRAENTDATASFELAQLLLLRRDGAAAVDWARKAAALEGNSTRVLNLLGDALVRTANVDEARNAWLGAAKVDENDASAVARLAQGLLDAADASLKERDPARAERLLRRVIALQPENAQAFAKLASALTRLGFARSASAWSERAAELAAPKR